MSDTTGRTGIDRNTEIRATRVRAKLTAMLQEALAKSGKDVDEIAALVGVESDRAEEVFAGESNFTVNALARYLAATGYSFDFEITLPKKRSRRRRELATKKQTAVRGSFKDVAIRSFIVKECTSFSGYGAQNAWIMLDGPQHTPDFIHVKDHMDDGIPLSEVPHILNFENRIHGSYEPGSSNLWVSSDASVGLASKLSEGKFVAH